jgi:toxin-antitoxin system PIN domain toxin
VNVVDANVLLYAVNRDAPHHAVAKRWLEDALTGDEGTVGFAWSVFLAFVRIATLEAAFERPLTLDEAYDYVESWLAQPAAVVVEPGIRHAARMRELCAEAGVGGNLVNDAHIAALAMETRGTVISFDSDFGRFPGLRWQRPGA